MKKIEKNNKYNFINESGTYLSDVWFDFVCPCNDRFTYVKLNNNIKYIFILLDLLYIVRMKT